MHKTIIAIAAGKGGTSKSTLAWGLGSYLSQESRVLLIDADPQATLSQAIVEDRGSGNAFEVLTRRMSVTEARVPALPTYGEMLSMIPATALLSGIEGALANDLDRQYALAEALESVDDEIVLIDCPAGQGLLVTMAMVAAEIVVSPVACSPPAFEALVGFAQTIALVQKRLNPRLRWFIVPSLFDQRNLLDRDVLAALRAQYGDRVLDPPIRRRISVAQDMAERRPCNHQDFELIANSLAERIAT